ncbi:hypothetical protein [Virgibacillus halodenitrificans]|uniref:hypothetical protein n=1 Tax=Virgibacillus halodenitrificans TaxID=1482 RepID=UPI000EF4F1BB|nr:hypothetical protein [Virgibacillus halodenitrificans]
MGRTLTFEQIVDSRFELTKEDLLQRHERLMTLLVKQKSLTVVSGKPIKYEWPNGTVQYRIRYHIKKEGRKLKWNDVYCLVNSVKPVPYDFIY